MEIWKIIPSSNGKYSASNLGRIRSEKRTLMRVNGRKQIINEKILTPILNTKGYFKVRLNIEQGFVKNLNVHSLVAEAFLNYKFNNYDLIVNHIDGNKLNNSLTNLELVSQKENINHAWSLNLSNNNHFKKAIYINGILFNSFNDACKFLNVDRNTIAKSVKRGYYIERKQKVIYNGITYESLKYASRVLGINPKTVKKYGTVCNSIKYKIEIC
jgi:hypothetical protein